MVSKKWVKNIQAIVYNGAHTVFHEISYVDNSFQAYQDGNLKNILLKIVGYRQDGQGCADISKVALENHFIDGPPLYM